MTLEKRFDLVSAMGAAFVLGWIACSGYYALPALWTSRNTAHAEVVVLKEKAKVLKGCASAAVPVARQAITAARTGAVPTPSPAALKPCAAAGVK